MGWGKGSRNTRQHPPQTYTCGCRQIGGKWIKCSQHR